MSMQDPVSDMLTCVRNAQAIGIKEIELPASIMKLSILRVMKEEGYIENFEEMSAGVKKRVKVLLKYYLGKAVIEKMKRISTATSCLWFEAGWVSRLSLLPKV